MAMPVRPLLAIGLFAAGIGVTVAVPIAAAPPAAAAPATSSAAGGHVVRNSAKASPTTRVAHTSASVSSAQGSAPTSNKRVLPTGAATQGAVKHHWGTHHGHHGLL
jgi:hypothetical protein